MKYAVIIVALSAISVAPRQTQAQANEANVAGAWRVDLDPDFGGNQDTIECTFQQDGRNVTGDCGPDC